MAWGPTAGKARETSPRACLSLSPREPACPPRSGPPTYSGPPPVTENPTEITESNSTPARRRGNTRTPPRSPGKTARGPTPTPVQPHPMGGGPLTAPTPAALRTQPRPDVGHRCLPPESRGSLGQDQAMVSPQRPPAVKPRQWSESLTAGEGLPVRCSQTSRPGLEGPGHVAWTSSLSSYKTVCTTGSRALRDRLEEAVGTVRVAHPSTADADRAQWPQRHATPGKKSMYPDVFPGLSKARPCRQCGRGKAE